MIHKLTEEDYENVRPLFRELDFNLIIVAVIERTSPGRIYVDNVSKPRTVFICSVEGYYLAGNENNPDFNALRAPLSSAEVTPNSSLWL